MRITGHTEARIAASFLLLRISVLAAAAEPPPPTPTPTPTQGESRLGEYAAGAALDRSALAESGGPVVITNDTVDRLGEQGMLTTCSPKARDSNQAAAVTGSTNVQPNAKRRGYWRKRVEKQRDRIAEVEEELALLDAKIHALEDRAFQSSRNTAKLWAQVDEQRERRKVIEDRLKREQSKLSTIIREARQEGAEPGWFR